MESNIQKIFLILFLSLKCVTGNQDYKDLFYNKRILITGGTGFIGKALVAEILKYNPKSIIVFSRDEVKHHKLQEEFPTSTVQSMMGDIREYNAILHATRDMDIVIHAAALKRIDLMEYHTIESVATNILGTLNVARACIQNNIKQALLVSTDKACSPVNTYGACKLIAEKIFTNPPVNTHKTTFVVVRYGNVLQSTESVIPYFLTKIKNNEEIPLTDIGMTRFFIAKEQAIELIFKALKYGKQGEIFIPVLPAFKIGDLVQFLFKKTGKVLPTKIIGIRPGEKLHELMINSTEALRTRKEDNVFIITSTVQPNNNPKAQLFGSGINEYSSEHAIISQQELDQLLYRYTTQV